MVVESRDGADAGPVRRLARALGAAARAMRRPGPGAALSAAVTGCGAHYVGASLHDGKAIGLDLDRATLLLAGMSADGSPSVSETPFAHLRAVTWTRVDPGLANLQGVGPAAFAGAVQAAAMNATARLQALDASGMRITLGDGADLRICLDGDEARLRRWESMIEAARSGSLAKPSSPVAV